MNKQKTIIQTATHYLCLTVTSLVLGFVFFYTPTYAFTATSSFDRLASGIRDPLPGEEDLTLVCPPCHCTGTQYSGSDHGEPTGGQPISYFQNTWPKKYKDPETGQMVCQTCAEVAADMNSQTQPSGAPKYANVKCKTQDEFEDEMEAKRAKKAGSTSGTPKKL